MKSQMRPSVPASEFVSEYAEPYIYEYFDTNPTVDSRRTNAWLAQHGIPLHTHAEFQNTGK